jgi:hypothetical protein
MDSTEMTNWHESYSEVDWNSIDDRDHIGQEIPKGEFIDAYSRLNLDEIFDGNPPTRKEVSEAFEKSTHSGNRRAVPDPLYFTQGSRMEMRINKWTPRRVTSHIKFARGSRTTKICMANMLYKHSRSAMYDILETDRRDELQELSENEYGLDDWNEELSEAQNWEEQIKLRPSDWIQMTLIILYEDYKEDKHPKKRKKLEDVLIQRGEFDSFLKERNKQIDGDIMEMKY